MAEKTYILLWQPTWLMVSKCQKASRKEELLTRKVRNRWNKTKRTEDGNWRFEMIKAFIKPRSHDAGAK